jgi:hypothetical protein
MNKTLQYFVIVKIVTAGVKVQDVNQVIAIKKEIDKD